MFSIIINLLLITISTTLIYRSGFFEAVDDWVNKKFKFYHLPHPFFCCLCGTFWLCLFYIIVTGNLSLFNFMCCLIMGYLTNVTIPLTKTIENILLKIVELINKLIGN